MTVIGTGHYVFGKNIQEGFYDLEVVSGEGSLWIYCKDKQNGYDHIYLGGKDEARSYKGLDSDHAEYFEIDGNLKVSLKKAETVTIG